MCPHPDVHQVLILDTDPLCRTILGRSAEAVFPDASVRCESDPGLAAMALADDAVDLFVVGVRGFDVDIITLLGVWAEHNTDRTRVLVVTPTPQSASLAALRDLPLSGIFDCSSSDLKQFEAALRAVASRGEYPVSSPSSTLVSIAVERAGVRNVDTPWLRAGTRPGRVPPGRFDRRRAGN